MGALHKLHRQRQRLAIIRKMALRFGRPDTAAMAQYYGAQLDRLIRMAPHPDYAAAAIGPNGMGPGFDDVAASVKYERARRLPDLAPVSGNVVHISADVLADMRRVAA